MNKNQFVEEFIAAVCIKADALYKSHEEWVEIAKAKQLDLCRSVIKTLNKGNKYGAWVNKARITYQTTGYESSLQVSSLKVEDTGVTLTLHTSQDECSELLKVADLLREIGSDKNNCSRYNPCRRLSLVKAARAWVRSYVGSVSYLSAKEVAALLKSLVKEYTKPKSTCTG